ncbi:MAG: hypothetical protein HQ564_01425 [Candidatus Saganbacteria bacterium]|nr:hypothetical protein [Candidatus Saganbacteria bacterium]
MFKKALFIILSLIFLSSISFSVPQYIDYQGMLRDMLGNTQTGTFSMRFKIYDAVTSGTEVFDSGAVSVSASNGLYNVRLGPVDSSTIFEGSDRWLEVSVGSDTLSPRLRINSVAYAIRADVATNADFATLSATATNAGTVDNFSASSTATASTLYPLDANAKLSGVPVSAEAATGFAMYVDGKLGASSSVIGTDTITNGNQEVTILDSNVTATSAIFVTAGPADHDHGGIWVSARSAGTITVKIANAAPFSGLPFWYLIVN